MKKKLLSLILGSLFICIAMGQNTDNKQPKRDVPTDNNEILLNYIKQLNDDTVKHREFVESYYNRLYATVLGTCTLLAGALSWGGHKYFSYQVKRYKKDLKSKFDEHFIEHYKKEFDVHNEQMQSKFKTLDDNTAAFNGLIENIKKDAESSHTMLTDLYEMYTDLSSKIIDNYVFEKSLTRLEYLKADGSEVTYVKNQIVKCISADQPVKLIDHFLRVDLPGVVEHISVKPIGRLYSVIDPTPQRQNVRLKFNDFTVDSEPKENEIVWKVVNGFAGEIESFTINQFNECQEEIFELVFLKERQCSKLICETVDQNGVPSEIEYTSNLEYTDSQVIYSLKLPQKPVPCKYKITWEF